VCVHASMRMGSVRDGAWGEGQGPMCLISAQAKRVWVARRGSFCAPCASVDGEDAGAGRGVAWSGVTEGGAGAGLGRSVAGCVGGGCRAWPSTEGVGWVGVSSRVRRAVVSTAGPWPACWRDAQTCELRSLPPGVLDSS
jgi:hypothetical protein